MELVIYDAFRKAGVEEAQAKIIAAELNTNFKATIAEVVDQHYAVHSQKLATQGDVEKVRLEVENVRLEIESVRLEVEKVRAEVARVETNIVKWIFGSIVTAAGLATGIALAIVRLFFTAS